VRKAITWTLRIAIAAVFLFEGLDKFSERRLWIRVFTEIGVGQWFRYFTGIVECAGAVLLLIPRTSVAGAALLACTMVGALLTHAFVIGVGPQTLVVSALLGALIVTMVTVRRSRSTSRIQSDE
jgi:uncharacterized membrane protein YphA (DoxX/SURF4 family)